MKAESVAPLASGTALDDCVYDAPTLDALAAFPTRPELLGQVVRPVPPASVDFFHEVTRRPFSLSGTVACADVAALLRPHLEPLLTAEALTHPFFTRWLDDIALMCRFYAALLGSDAVGLRVGTARQCRRYHIDNVPHRLLVTYYGAGTEWLLPWAADSTAYAEGAPNDDIVKEAAGIQHIQPWDVAIFKGGETGLLHRTPDKARLQPSLLLRLDGPRFWDHELQPR